MMNVGDGLAARFKSFSFFLFPLPRKSSNDFEDKIRERETIGESVGWISIHRASISMKKVKIQHSRTNLSTLSRYSATRE